MYIEMFTNLPLAECSLIVKYLLNIRETVSTEVLTRNVKVIAEALARQVFSLAPDGQHEIFTEGLVSNLANEVYYK